MDRADPKALGELHGLIAKYFNSRLQSGDELKPAELSVIVTFLKNNGIDCVGTDSEELNDIFDNLPTFTSKEELDDVTLLN